MGGNISKVPVSFLQGLVNARYRALCLASFKAVPEVKGALTEQIEVSQKLEFLLGCVREGEVNVHEDTFPLGDGVWALTWTILFLIENFDEATFKIVWKGTSLYIFDCSDEN